MTVTGYEVERFGELTVITPTSDLSGDVQFYWYLEGAYIGSTRGAFSVLLEDGAQEKVEAVDSNSSSFDPLAAPPAGYPARRTLTWTRPPEADVSGYRVYQDKDSGGFSLVAELAQGADTWEHRYLTERLTDLSTYTWEIRPLDAAGNEGTALTIGPELVVRRPDAPAFLATLKVGTTVEFTAA